jgi:hypothetical protein
MATRMQQRRGTAAQWISTNSGNGPILNAGEIGYETDTNKFKIGDGTNHWINLDYFVDANSIANPSIGSSIVFEGTTENAYETTLFATDPTADRTITLPNATGTVVLADGSGNVTVSGDLTVSGTTTIINSTVLEVQNEIKFEGATANGFETSLKVVDPTADRDITFPDATGTVAILDTTQTLTNKTINLTSNTLTGTKAQFNTAMSDADFATIDGIETLTNKTITSPSGLVKSDVGLGNVDNTADTAKPVSTAQQTALDLKANLASPTFTGTVVLPSSTVTSAMILNDTILNADINTAAAIDWTKLAISSTVSSTEIGYVDGVTSAIQTQLNGKQATVANVSDVEIGYLDGVTSSIQTQMDAKAPLASPTFTGTVTLPSGTVTSTMILDGTIANADINAAAAIDWTKLGISSTVSSTEIGYVDGVTSAIQTQLDAKSPLASPTFTGTVNAANLTLSGDLTVNGTTTTINSTTLSVDDKNIVIGDVSIPSDVTADGGGITLKGATDKTFNWVDATDAWTSSEHINLASGKDLKVNGTAVISSTAGGFIFTDGTQTLEGTPSRTVIIQKTASYTLSALSERDDLIEMGSASAMTLTIPLNSAVAFPVGTSIDILQTSTGQVTIAGDAGVTVNATPGLKLRTQWSTATLFKRATNTWVVYGDLTA